MYPHLLQRCHQILHGQHHMLFGFRVNASIFQCTFGRTLWWTRGLDGHMLHLRTLTHTMQTHKCSMCSTLGVPCVSDGALMHLHRLGPKSVGMQRLQACGEVFVL